MKTCSNYSVSQHKGTRNQPSGCLAVSLEKFLQSCFNKLPCVSICSTTGEWELTFQRAAPCALRAQQPQVSSSASFITPNDWMADRRPSVTTPEYCPSNPCCVPLLPINCLFFAQINERKSSFYSNRSLALGCSDRLALCSRGNNRQGSPAGGSTGFSAGCLGHVNTIKICVGAVCAHVCVCGRCPVASSSLYPNRLFSFRGVK